MYFDHPPLVDDLAAVTPPRALGTFMAVRHYLPLGLPLLKHVAALGGATVCRHDLAISINGMSSALALRQTAMAVRSPIGRVAARFGPVKCFSSIPPCPNLSMGGTRRPARHHTDRPGHALACGAIAMIAGLSPRSAFGQLGACLANTWHSQAPWADDAGLWP